MRVCVIGDVSAAITPAFGGHGLGQAVYRIAERLRVAGHDVTLVAGKGSEFSGTLITPVESERDYSFEPQLANAAYKAHSREKFDVFMDNSHMHVLSQLFPELPVVNAYHDIFQPPTRCAVMMSHGQKALMPPWCDGARVIHHAVDPQEMEFRPKADEPPYAILLGLVRDYKQPLLAIEACAIKGIGLKVVGAMPPGVAQIVSRGTNVEFLGPLVGKAKVDVLGGASVLLQLGTVEAFGLTTVEAGLCGVPVVAWPVGGACDIVRHGVSGAFVPGSANRPRAVADTITRAMECDREACFDHAMNFGDVAAATLLWERTLMDCARGVRW